MQATTEQGLETSKAFLKDCVELSHLMLKRQLEKLRNGGDVDWKEVREVVKEGRTAVRQLTQIASVELRDRQQTTRESGRRPRAPRPTLKLKVEPTREMIMNFFDGIFEWQKACMEAGKTVPLPKRLREQVEEFGLNPDDPRSVPRLIDHFEGFVDDREAA
jgi:hypothetical protein